jgi:hypothetical protein
MSVSCSGYSADPNDFLGGTIVGYSVYKYDSSTGSISSNVLKPYTLTGDDGSLTFEKNKSYTITFTDNV